VRDHHVVADRHAEHAEPFFALGNDVAERRQVSERQPLHHLGRLVEVWDSGEEGIEGEILQQIEGANQRWLSFQLPFEQPWLLIDQDPQALQRDQPVAPRTRLLTAAVKILTSVLDRLGSAQLVTRSALLDLLTIDQLGAIGSALAVALLPCSAWRWPVPWNCRPPFDSHMIRAFIS
jgi:hypothetical protein